MNQSTEPQYNNDGIPANVPQSVADVIEDVIHRYNSDHFVTDPSDLSPAASGSSASGETTNTNQSPYQLDHSTQSNNVSQPDMYHSSPPGGSNFHSSNMSTAGPPSNIIPLPAMHTLTRNSRIGVGYYE